MKKSLEITALIAIIVGLVINAIYWGTQKKGFVGDELGSHHFVCNVDYPSVNGDREDERYAYSWHDSDYYNDYLTISDDERFDITGVWESIKEDVHPPIFFILLEITLSLLPNHLTKWGGISLNIVFFILTLIILYCFAKRLLRSEVWAMVTTALYGISTGAISNVVFIRMYMLLTAITILFLYIHYLIWNAILEGDTAKKQYLLIAVGGLALALGVLTHYYFLVFGFFTCAFMVLGLTFKKKFKVMFVYAGIMLGALGLSVLVWNDIYLDLLTSSRGEQAVAGALNTSEWFGLISEYAVLIVGEISGIPFVCFAAGLVVLGAAYIILSLKRREDGAEDRFDQRHMIFYQMIVAVIMDAVIIAIVAPYRSGRYICNLLPAIMLILAFVLKGVVDKITAEKARIITGIIIGVGALAMVISGYYVHHVNYLVPDYERVEEVLKDYHDLPVLLVTDKNARYTSTTSSYFLKDFPNTYVVVAQMDKYLEEAFSEAALDEDMSEFVCFVASTIDPDSTVARICELTGCENLGSIGEIEAAKIYVLKGPESYVYEGTHEEADPFSLSLTETSGLPDGTVAAMAEQGPAAMALFAEAMPQDYVQGFSFNLITNAATEDSRKSGLFTLTVPEAFRGENRDYVILALDKSGSVYVLTDTDTDPETITVDVDCEGYAFDVGYKD